jgi:hypothetical protein
MARREEVLDRQVFSAAGRSFSWHDVIEAARAWSDWSEVERRAREALALPPGAEERVPREELETAQNEFRYARNLLAADDLEVWLAGWGIEVDDWLRHMRAGVSRRHGSGAGPGAPGDSGRLAAAAWAEAVCSGELERLARKLAERCAVLEATEETIPPELSAADFARMDQVHRSFRDAAVTEEALERRLQEERLEWTRIEGRYLAHASEDIVREAALCVREEGRELEEMAQAAGARYEPAARFYLADAEDQLKAHLMAAASGELYGPFPSGEEHWLLEVGARVAPSLDDRELRARAASEVAEHAVEQQVLQRIRWHERVADRT